MVISTIPTLPQIMTSIQLENATDLIKFIDPEDLVNIRALYSGNKVDLDVFSRTIRTYVPKYLTQSEDLLDKLASCIVDLFEELDSDADGFITWPDFIAYYSEASSKESKAVTQLPVTQTVFNKVQDRSQ